MKGYLISRPMLRIVKAVCLIIMLSGFVAIAYAQEGREIMKKSERAFLYAGKDFKVRVTMKLISSSGKTRLRELTMLRKNSGASGGEQKYFIYFHRPADVKGMTFMVYKYPDRDDDRWLFIPALNMVRRVAAQDRASSFVGSDFTYEDISGRDIDEDRHELLREDNLNGEECFVVKSTPVNADMPYSYRLSWISKKNYLPLKIEYYDLSGILYKVFTADEIKDIDGFPTVVKRTMKNLQSGHRTEVTFRDVQYNVNLKERIFSERYLRRPPREYIK
ncbi:MAG: outer membrane lipoprotein-sorting protein [Nitrospirae bacterium]|nr:outer membrane lipoprotein-sorting protein [Nitrospirota bacterium]